MTDQPKPRRKVARRAAHGSGYVLLILLAVLAVAAWRLTQDAIALPAWTVDRIETRIARDLGDHGLDLGGVALAYDLDAQALRLRLTDAVLSAGDAPLVTLPDARVSLDGAALVQGKIRPRRVTVSGLELAVGRDAEGRFSLALGQGDGELPSDWPEALAMLDTALAMPVIADLRDVTIDGVQLRFDDAVTGLSQQVEKGTLTWRRDMSGVRLGLDMAVTGVGGHVAYVALTLERGVQGQGAQARAWVSDLSLPGLAQALPGVPALTLAKGDISAEATMTLSEDGTPGPVRGRLRVAEASMTDRPAMAVDRARLAVEWVPGSGRVELTEIRASSDELSVQADGQVLLEDGATGPIQVQLFLGPTIINPDGMFDRRVAFDQGLFEARLTQEPLALHVGQAFVSGPSGMARLSGQLDILPEGLGGTMRLALPQMGVSEVAALWPPHVAANARRWFTTNLLSGEVRDAVALVRLAPGEAPETQASFAFQSGNVRYMRFMPPGEGAYGVGQLDGGRLTLRFDAGTVPALGPGDTLTEDTPRIDIAGTTLTIPDARERPLQGEVDLIVRGEISDVLTALNNRPFRLLERLNKTSNLATGQAEGFIRVELPFRKGNAPADIFWDVDATLSNAQSTEIIPGRTIAANTLRLRADRARVEIGGEGTLDGVPFSGTWRQALPPPSDQPMDPNATPPPPRPLPEPGRVTGVAQIDPAGLARFGIRLDALRLSGRTRAEIDVTLPQGQSPQLALTSDLRGLSVALPAIGWRKPTDSAATFSVAARLGAQPEVTRIALDARGLEAVGAISFRADRSLNAARFERVDTGWFRGPVTLSGRGPGAKAAISIGGGTADLRRALLSGAGSDDGGGGGPPAPLSVALNSLTVTEGIALTDLRADLRGATGSFNGRINGGAPIEGVLAPGAGGTVVQVQGGDAGAVLRSAGLFEDARGGTIRFTLRPTEREGHYDGAVRMANLRVRNAPALASLLQALSVVGILEQLTGEGLAFGTVESDFTLRPDDIAVRRASAVGPSMSITADGLYDLGSKRLDMEGVISPIYLVNGLFGALFARQDEGLFGFTYRLRGPADDPQVAVNPLSILTPGIFREIFRRAPPS